MFKGDSARLGAWFWLVSRACWKPTPFNINGKMVTLDRGQVCVSIRTLADEWGWSKSSVDRFITRLKTETMIETEAGQGRLIITICNYSKYQDREEAERDSSGTPTGTAAGQQRDIKEQGNNRTRVEDTNVSSPPHTPPAPKRAAKPDHFPCPEWCEPKVWGDLKRNRRTKRLTNTETAYEQFIADVMALVDDDWPPGKLVKAIAAKGWGGAYDPRKDERNPTSDRQHSRHARSTTRETGERVAARFAAGGGRPADVVPLLGPPRRNE